MLHEKAVSSELLDLIKKLQSLQELSEFRLVGGTALALQLGHRSSVDIDLFSNKHLDKAYLQFTIENFFPTIREIAFTSFGMTCFINEIKLDLCFDGGKFIRPPIMKSDIKLASLQDIAAMKLNAITNRATQKDFFDIAVLSDFFSLKEMLQFYKEKYFFMNARIPIDCLRKHTMAGVENPVHPLIAMTWKDAAQKIDSITDTFIADQKSAKQKEIKKRLKNAETLLVKKKK